jgi:hypothetical protein
MILFKRFYIGHSWSPNGLWWTELKDHSFQFYLFHIAIIEKTIDGVLYKGVQLIICKSKFSIATIPKK